MPVPKQLCNKWWSSDEDDRQGYNTYRVGLRNSGKPLLSSELHNSGCTQIQSRCRIHKSSPTKRRWGQRKHTTSLTVTRLHLRRRLQPRLPVPRTSGENSSRPDSSRHSIPTRRNTLDMFGCTGAAYPPQRHAVASALHHWRAQHGKCWRAVFPCSDDSALEAAHLGVLRFSTEKERMRPGEAATKEQDKNIDGEQTSNSKWKPKVRHSVFLRVREQKIMRQLNRLRAKSATEQKIMRTRERDSNIDWRQEDRLTDRAKERDNESKRATPHLPSPIGRRSGLRWARPLAHAKPHSFSFKTQYPDGHPVSDKTLHRLIKVASRSPSPERLSGGFCLHLKRKCPCFTHQPSGSDEASFHTQWSAWKSTSAYWTLRFCHRSRSLCPPCCPQSRLWSSWSWSWCGQSAWQREKRKEKKAWKLVIWKLEKRKWKNERDTGETGPRSSRSRTRILTTPLHWRQISRTTSHARPVTTQTRNTEHGFAVCRQHSPNLRFRFWLALQ